jgi:hypothetical protein
MNMKVKSVYNLSSNTFLSLLRKVVSGFFMVSAVLKVFAVDYMIDLFFTLMPLSWIGWMSQELILAGLLILVAVEILLGILLWMGIQLSKVLTATILFLTLMSLLNSYQLWLGVADCGCLGGWFSMPPATTIVKSLIMLLVVTYQ